MEGLFLLCEIKEFADFWFIEADDNIFTNHDDGDAHLTSDFAHFLTLFGIVRYVVIGVLNLIFIEEIFCHVAEVTCWC